MIGRTVWIETATHARILVPKKKRFWVKRAMGLKKARPDPRARPGLVDRSVKRSSSNRSLNVLFAGHRQQS